MAQETKCYDFFPTSRRRLTLLKYELLEDEGKKQKLTVEDVLTGEALVGMPEWVSNPFLEMQKEKSLTGRTPITAVCEGMTMDIFATPKQKRRTHFSTGVQAKLFALVPHGEGDKKEISLTYSLIIPANIDIHHWAWELYRGVFFADFEYSQTEMDFPAADKDGEPVAAASGGDDPPAVAEQDDDPDSAAQIAARARKPFNSRAVANAVN